VVMANMRGMRALVYVREWLHPLAAELARDARFLAWESIAGDLYTVLAGRFGRALKPMLSGAVVVFLIGMASLWLVIAACTVQHSPWSRRIAGIAAACDLAFMFAAFRFARLSELRQNVRHEVVADLQRRAAHSARFRAPAGSPPG